MTDREMITELYSYLESYAEKKNLQNTRIAIQLVKNLSPLMDDKSEIDTYLFHCLSIGKLLSELRLPLPVEEEDEAIASALLHTLSKHVAFRNFSKEMTEKYGISQKICDIVLLITLKDITTEEELYQFYERIKTNKLALLVRIAERSNLVERLHSISVWRARQQIAETKRYFFPMCIYAKETYPELSAPLNILMGKMQSLVDVAEILFNKFEQAERDLSSEIIYLKEENARIRTVIRELEKE